MTPCLLKPSSIFLEINNKLQLRKISALSIFEIALQNVNVEIVNVEIICIEMKWQRVSVIIKSTSAISTSISNGMRFAVFFALNYIYKLAESQS